MLFGGRGGGRGEFGEGEGFGRGGTGGEGGFGGEQGGIGAGGAGGGRGGGAGGPLGGPGGFGGMRGGGRLQGNANYTLGGSMFDAAPYTLNGRPREEPDYVQQRYGASLGGPLSIPGLFNGGTRTSFFFNYSGNHSRTPVDAYSTVPTPAERAGDFSANSSIVIDPDTGEPFAWQPCAGVARRSGGAIAARLHSAAERARHDAELSLRHRQLVEEQRREPAGDARLRGASLSAAPAAAAAAAALPQAARAAAVLVAPVGPSAGVPAAAVRCPRAACSTPAWAFGSRRTRARRRSRRLADPPRRRA